MRRGKMCLTRMSRFLEDVEDTTEFDQIDSETFGKIKTNEI